MKKFETLSKAVTELAIKHDGIFAEYKISEDNDYLSVEFSNWKGKGIEIIADFELPTSFSGNVKKTCEGFYVPFDECFDSIYHYFELISDEITEGYLLPNNLMFDE